MTILFYNEYIIITTKQGLFNCVSFGFIRIYGVFLKIMYHKVYAIVSLNTQETIYLHFQTPFQTFNAMDELDVSPRVNLPWQGTRLNYVQAISGARFVLHHAYA